MARLRRLLAFFTVTAAVLIAAAPAQPATPQSIYKDLADNGRLDRQYKRADIVRAFNLERVVKTDPSVPAHVRRPTAVATPVEARPSSRRVPFTGLDVALLIVGGGPLLLIGIGLRRRLVPAGTAGVVRS